VSNCQAKYVLEVVFFVQFKLAALCCWGFVKIQWKF